MSAQIGQQWNVKKKHCTSLLIFNAVSECLSYKKYTPAMQNRHQCKSLIIKAPTKNSSKITSAEIVCFKYLLTLFNKVN